ncbi:MAG: TasA family protein [Candidatus Paceibacterota bacterium]
MKKILISALAIVAVGGAVAGVTMAYFNDTETSAGNIFTAGTLDLKVDHTAQSFDGVDCKTCSVTIQSDTSNMVVAKNDVPRDPTAAVLAWTHSAWTANVSNSNAKWIWVTNPVTQEDLTNNVVYTFEKKFTWWGPVTGASMNLAVASDNTYEVWLNGVKIATDASEDNFHNADSVPSVNISSHILQGENVLQFKVKNKALQPSNPQSNPAGLLYSLVLNGNCGDSSWRNQCKLWGEKDLGAGDIFWNFNGIKPGDYGRDVISMHSNGNDAHACIIPNNVVEVSQSLEHSGKLSDSIRMFAWDDVNKNGVKDSGETVLVEPTTLGAFRAQLAVIPAGTTSYAGIAWCAGTFNPDYSCNGAGMGNDVQGAQYTASVTVYAEQAENNLEFSCQNVQLVQPN